MAKVMIPVNLIKFSNQQNEITIHEINMFELIKNIQKENTFLFNKIFNENYSLKPFVAIFKGELQILNYSKEELSLVKIGSEDVIHIMLAFSGG